MTEQRCFEGLVLDGALRLAWTDRGEQVRLTRRERGVLQRLLANPGQILSRDQLLDAFGAAERETFDRNIDYVVHRLRQKLGDRARRPRFIETQYGEGYVWVAKPLPEADNQAFLAIGPIAPSDTLPEASASVLQQIAGAFTSAFGPTHPVHLRPHWRFPEEGGSAATYALGADLLTRGNLLHVSLVLRCVRTDQIIGAFRLTIGTDGQARRDIAACVSEVRNALWRHVAMPAAVAAAPFDWPQELRLVDAATMFSPQDFVWQETRTRLEALRAERGPAPELDIAWALGLRCWLVLGDQGRFADMDEWHAADEEIEALALAALPAIQSDSTLTLAASRLLFFVNRGHLALAEDLAERAFATGTGFGAFFVTMGLIKLSAQDFEAAMDSFRRAREHTVEGDLFWRYVSTIECTALLAWGRRSDAVELAEALYRHDLTLRDRISIFLVDPEANDIPASLSAMLSFLELEQARNLVRYLYMVQARHYTAPVQRLRIMEGLVSVLQSRFALGDLLAELPEDDRDMLVTSLSRR